MAAWPGARPGTGTHRAQDTDLRFRLVAQRYRHNTLCRHELGRRVAGFACVRLFTTGQVEWVPNKPHALLPFEENLEQFGTPTLVRAAQQSAHAWIGC